MNDMRGNVPELKKTGNESRRFHCRVVLWLCVLSLSVGWGPLDGQAGEQHRLKPGSAALGPVADIPVSTHDLGTIRSKGTTYHHDFLILNVGSEVLEVREVVVG